jgi:cardiolipin synthase
MLLIPAFVFLVVYGQLGWALTVFVTAGITDGLDGLIARWSGQKTTIGAWLDPMADKLLLVTTFVVLTLPGLDLVNRLPVWLTVLIISRDVGIVLTVAIINLAVGQRTFRPSSLGKAATAIYILTAVVAMLFNYLRYRSRIVDTFVYASLTITLLSGFHYIWHAARSFDAPSRINDVNGPSVVNAVNPVSPVNPVNPVDNVETVKTVKATGQRREDQLKRVRTS